jgi:agmatinase
MTLRPQDTGAPFAGCFGDGRSAFGRLVFLGLADDSQSTLRRGSAAAPAALRRAYHDRSYNACSESGADLTGAVIDLGDLEPREGWELDSERYRRTVASVVERGGVPFVAGGDHAVTVPAVAAMAPLPEPVQVVIFDAHPDLYSDYEGSRTSHACVAARLLEMEHVASVGIVGVRTLNPPQRRTAEEHGPRLRMVPARRLEGPLPALEWLEQEKPVYLSVDLDAFDPAFAPGVAHPVPGGLSPRQVLSWLQRQSFPLAGMDVVECNPELDQGERTQVLAARLLIESIGLAMKQIAG